LTKREGKRININKKKRGKIKEHNHKSQIKCDKKGERRRWVCLFNKAR
jgi:hypothetical protein